MGSYASAQSAALSLIKRKGAPATFRRTSTTLDPVSQARSESTATASLYTVGLPPGRSAEFHLGSLQRRNIIELHIAQKGSTFAPQPGDVVAWAGHEWAVIWSTTYDPDADGAIYTKAYAER